jgi:hypothetical protein
MLACLGVHNHMRPAAADGTCAPLGLACVVVPPSWLATQAA